MRKLSSLIKFKALSILVVAMSGTTANAKNGWNPIEVIDIAATYEADKDFVVTTGFLEKFDLVSFERPALRIARGNVDVGFNPKSTKGGWAGRVEVELDQDSTLQLEDVSTFSDVFTGTDRDAKVSGFYTMRYEFDTQLTFHPYAGAGLGVVTTTNEADTSGVIAGRATAGFDLTLGKGSAVFAEYAYVRNGGVSLGGSSYSSIIIPDEEHSLKLGFRRIF